MSVVLFATGGTGGHVTPALAAAAALAENHPQLTPEFVGSPGGLEARLVPAAGWRLHAIEAAPLRRRAVVDNLRLPSVLLRATRGARRLVRERGAVGMCSFGGYVSVPSVLAARLTRCPLVVHEQNAVPGLANRVAARWAAAIAVSVPETAQRFPADRVEFTGNPVRGDLAGVDRGALRAQALTAFGLDGGRATLLAFGGSLGARRINDALLDAADRWQQPGAVQVLHVAGARDHQRVREAWAAEVGVTLAEPGSRPELRARGRLLVACVDFVERMDLAYAAADVVVCRAGASSIAELTVLGVPGVLVPYPHAIADEQSANARALAEAGGGVVVSDADHDGPALVTACEPLLVDPRQRERMAVAAGRLGRADAAERLAALIARTVCGAGARP